MALNVGERASGEIFGINDKDKILRNTEVVRLFIEADGFIDAAADFVADDSAFVDFFRDDNREALETTGVFTVDEGNFRVADGFAMGVDVFDATARVEPVLAG